MLETWGYFYAHVGLALGFSESRIATFREANRNTLAEFSGAPNYIAANDPIIEAIYTRCDEILKFIDHQDLGAVPRHLEGLKAKIAAAKRKPFNRLDSTDVASHVETITNDLTYILSTRYFYSLAQQDAALYGKPELFGPKVAKKFPAAANDIEWAGNCLALGQPTACVLHLNRAMEIALHRLAKKLRVTVLATDNMGGILGKMTDPIKAMPDKTEAQKRKKERWAECRTNLYHVKMHLRDPSSHGKQTYETKQARDILAKVRDFMQQLATLL